MCKIPDQGIRDLLALMDQGALATDRFLKNTNQTNLDILLTITTLTNQKCEELKNLKQNEK
jgi:hypothetical protein